jgi:hypothetical protein
MVLRLLKGIEMDVKYNKYKNPHITARVSQI